jgi:hypothetical protein
LVFICGVFWKLLEIVVVKKALYFVGVVTSMYNYTSFPLSALTIIASSFMSLLFIFFKM